MNEEKLKQILKKYGYRLEKIHRFKKHDRIRIKTPPDPTLRTPLTIVVTLRKHLEDTPRNGLLEAILSKDELEKEVESWK